MNAPVGPPICTLLPLNREIIKPPIIEVYNPCSGLTPDAIAKAMASGSATIPTIIPALKSFKNNFKLYPSFNNDISKIFSQF